MTPMSVEGDGVRADRLFAEVQRCREQLAAMTAERDRLLSEFGAEDFDELRQVIVPKGWEGLLTILNEVYPASIFGGVNDDWEDQTRDLGPRLVTLGRHLDAAREELELLRFIRAHAEEYRYEDENGEPNWTADESDILARYQPAEEPEA